MALRGPKIGGIRKGGERSLDHSASGASTREARLRRALSYAARRREKRSHA